MTEKHTEQEYDYRQPQQLAKSKIFNSINEYFMTFVVDDVIYHQSVIKACGKVLRDDINKYLDSQITGFLSLCENSPEKRIPRIKNPEKATT